MSASPHALLRLAETLRAEYDTEAERVRFEDPAGELVVTSHGGPGSFRIALELARELRVTIALRRMREEDLWDLWHDPALTFDDPSFDDALLVRGEPAQSLRALLDTETRALLLELHGCSRELSLDKLGITVACGERALIEATERTIALGRRLLGVRSIARSAYR